MYFFIYFILFYLFIFILFIFKNIPLMGDAISCAHLVQDRAQLTIKTLSKVFESI